VPAVRFRPSSRAGVLRLAAVAAATSLAIVLAGCTGSSSATKTSTPSSSPSSVSAACVKSGSVSDSVKVTGDFGASPNVTIEAPLKLTTTQRTVVTPGTGAKVRPGGTANVSFTLYNGTTGDTVTSTGYGDGRTSPIVDDASQIISGLAKTINCAQAGTRVVGVAPASEAFGSTGNTQLGITANQVMVFVVDVVSVVPTKASGETQPAVAGLPTVKNAADGTPKVTIPSGYKAPTTSQIATLIKGGGTVVAATDTVVIQYQGINLRTGKIFQQTWGGSAYTSAVSNFVPGFTNAIVGQTVGSQVLAIIVPADGYGSTGQSSAGIKGTDTILFVVDILATEPAAAG
jgi:peptidylprolyl isomerase